MHRLVEQWIEDMTAILRRTPGLDWRKDPTYLTIIEHYSAYSVEELSSMCETDIPRAKLLMFKALYLAHRDFDEKAE